MRTGTAAGLKRATQVFVLGTFTALVAFGRLGFWAIAFILGLIVEAIRPGRLYCRWLCPIRAAHGLADRGSAARPKKGARFRGSRAIKALGGAFIAAFLVLFGISLALGWRGWLFPSFVGIGIILSFELSLLTLCASFCPLGAAFVLVRQISGRISALIGATPRSVRRAKDDSLCDSATRAVSVSPSSRRSCPRDGPRSNARWPQTRRRKRRQLRSQA